MFLDLRFLVAFLLGWLVRPTAAPDQPRRSAAESK